jgi:hypothetical protein
MPGLVDHSTKDDSIAWPRQRSANNFTTNRRFEKITVANIGRNYDASPPFAGQFELYRVRGSGPTVTAALAREVAIISIFA